MWLIPVLQEKQRSFFSQAGRAEMAQLRELLVWGSRNKMSHTTRGVNIRNAFSHSSEGQKSKILVLAGFTPSQVSLFGLYIMVSPTPLLSTWSSLCVRVVWVLIPSSYGGHLSYWVRAHPSGFILTWSTLKGPSSKCILRNWDQGFDL